MTGTPLGSLAPSPALPPLATLLVGVPSPEDPTKQTFSRALPTALAKDASRYLVVADGVTDNLSMLRSYFNDVVAAGGGEIVIPAGRYMVSSTLTALLTGNGSLSIRGAGADLTELVFPGGCDGIVITYASAADYRRDAATGCKVSVSGLSLVTAGAAVSNRGLVIVGDTNNANGVLQPPTPVSGVTTRGTSAGGSWLQHIVLQDTADTVCRDILCAGPNADLSLSDTGSGIVIDTTAQRVSTVHVIDNLLAVGLNIGVEIDSGIQGVEVVGSNMAGVNYGIKWVSAGTQEDLTVVNCEFSALTAGILASFVLDVEVSTSVFYNQNSYSNAPGTWVAIQLGEVGGFAITGNTLQGAGVGVEYAITVADDTTGSEPPVPATLPSVAAGNVFQGIHGEVIYVSNTAADVFITGNAFDGIAGATPISIGSTAKVTTANNQFAGALYLRGFPGSAEPSLIGDTVKTFGSIPTHPSPAAGDSSFASATTGWVTAAIQAALLPEATTAALQAAVQAAIAPLATTASVNAAITAAVNSLLAGAAFNGPVTVEGQAVATTTPVLICNGGYNTPGAANHVIINMAVPSLDVLPSVPTPGQIYTVKDGSGLASAGSAITIATSNGATIDAQGSYEISTPYGVAQFAFNGTSWNVV